MAIGVLGWCSAIAVLGLSTSLAWVRDARRGAEAQVPRPVHEFPRTAQVLDESDCAYLAEFYWGHVKTWSQTYFNMLLRRWNDRDERLGAIFAKVVAAANRVGGEGSDYTITNDFFSYRTENVAQFAPQGIFHTDCDFWKTPSADGFNLWILIDHHGLNTSFEILERGKNAEFYSTYTGGLPLNLLPRNASDPDPAFARLPLRQMPFRHGHGDVLSWRGQLQVAASRLKGGFAGMKKRLNFNVTHLNTSTVQLSLGEALVLREQELHRTDLHTVLVPGQYRLAAGFKLQRKSSIVRYFAMGCTAQQDRFNIPLLWERLGSPVVDHYLEASSGRHYVTMDFSGKIAALLAANRQSMLCVGLAGVALRSRGMKTSKAVVVTALLAALPLLFVVYVQRDFFSQSAVAKAGEGGRLRATIDKGMLR